MFLPSSSMLPFTRAMSIVSFMRLRQRRNVDLPQPDGPIMEITWCRPTSRSTPKMACLSP
jgi:hypothetical protein